MKTPLLAAMTALLVLGACSTVRESRLNPFGWFGGSQSETPGLMPESSVIDNRALVDQVLNLRVEQVPGGAIIHATGLTRTQGWWDAELVAQNHGRPQAGELTYHFRVAAPRSQTRVSTEASRRVTAAQYVPQQVLDQVRRVVVVGAGNQQVSSR